MGKSETAEERERRLAYHRDYYQANKERARELYDENRDKKLAQDKVRRSSPEWKAKEAERRRAYYLEHREELLANRADYYAANADEERAKQRERYLQANAEARAAYYRERNADPEVKARNEAKQAEWRAANKHLLVENMSRRRMRVIGGEYEVIDRLAVWERDAGTCRICGSEVQPDDWHMDHIIPVSRGGSHTYDNVAVTHPTCNMRKHGADPREPGSRYAYLLEGEAG